MGSLFWVEEEETQADSRGGGITGFCQSPPSTHRRQGKRRPRQCLLFSFVFCSFSSSSRCWEAPCLFTCWLSRSSASSSTSPSTGSTISSIYEQGKGEQEGEREREEGDFIFLFFNAYSLPSAISITSSLWQSVVPHVPLSSYPSTPPSLSSLTVQSVTLTSF